MKLFVFFFFFQAEDGIRDHCVTGVQTCALPILTDALEDGPVGLAEDLGRRVQLSVGRAIAGWVVALQVFGGVAALIALALRERRPLLLSLLAALAVSLIVNDSPNDVVIAGLVCYVVLSSAPGLARPAREREQPAPRARPARTPQASSP